jgi:hypothetical protein
MISTQTEMAAHDKVTWEFYIEAVRAGAMRMAADATVASYYESLNSKKSWERMSVSSWDIESMKDRAAQALATESQWQARLEAHEKAYTGWSRFWCVPNGHIHSSRNCSTCNKMGKPTEFYLAHEVSGMDEAAAVAAQGPVLCTTCFPTAPLDWTNGLDEAAKAKKAAECPGSRTYDYDTQTARMGYYAGNAGTCNHCGGRITLTSANKLRGHKPEKKD